MRDSIFKFAEPSLSLSPDAQYSEPQKLEDKLIFNAAQITGEFLKHFDCTEHGSALNSEAALKSAHAALGFVCQAYPIFQAEFQDADMFFKSFVKGIFYYPSKTSAGGSAGSLPGIIWACPRKSWSVYDVVEFLIHECVHQFLFIDEEIHQHYAGRVLSSSEEIMCYSAIRKQYRPLPLVFHSVCVAVEVLRSRFVSHALGNFAQFAFHPSSAELIQSCERSLSEIIEQHLQNFSVRGHELIEFLERSLNLIKTAQTQRLSTCD